MSKYIIKNCPAYSENQGVYWTCYEDNNKLLCQDCTDCLLKQIVEKCRVAQKEYPKKFSDEEMDMFVSGRNNLAGIILALLDIQEVK